jgi:hypothetical protein
VKIGYWQGRRKPRKLLERWRRTFLIGLLFSYS